MPDKIKTGIAGCGYLAQDDPRVHFGLGETAHVDTLTVTWPSGRPALSTLGGACAITRGPPRSSVTIPMSSRQARWSL